MERNSRDFVSRSERINQNAEAVCDILRSSSKGALFVRACNTITHWLMVLESQTSLLSKTKPGFQAFLRFLQDAKRRLWWSPICNF